MSVRHQRYRTGNPEIYRTGQIRSRPDTQEWVSKLHFHGKKHDGQCEYDSTDRVHTDLLTGFVDDKEQDQEYKGCKDIILCGL